MVLFIDKGNFSPNPKHYPYLGGATTSAWNFCARFSDIISRRHFAGYLSVSVSQYVHAKLWRRVWPITLGAENSHRTREKPLVPRVVADWLTTRTYDLEVQGLSLPRRVVSLDKELYSTLSLFTQVYKWVLATYCWG